MNRIYWLIFLTLFPLTADLSAGFHVGMIHAVKHTAGSLDDKIIKRKNGAGNITTTGTAPAAAFSFSPSAPVTGQTVTFTDASANTPSSWSWTFGDGGSSTTRNPTHIYASSGTYTAALTAANMRGLGSISHVVTVGAAGAFTLTSSAGPEGAAIPAEYTCSGSSSSPSMSWTNAPSGTQLFALTMSEVTPQAETKYNWVLYGIPSSSSGFVKNTTGGGTLGESDGASGTAYNPPCGPGNRQYTFRLYALSGAPSLPSNPAQVTGGVLTAALASLTISSASMTLTYTPIASAAAPAAAFTFSPAVPTAGQTVTFTDASTNTPASWAWNFGDGSTSTLQSPSHVFTSSGSYAVSLTASNMGGSSSVSHSVTVAAAGAFTLTSPVGAEGTDMSSDYTCDGSYASPALAWSGAPTRAQQFALLMTTLPGDGTTKWNWVLYGIPAAASGLDKNTSGVGVLGINSDTISQAYAAPCSQGPGPKVYTYTLYALSGSPSLPAADQVTGSVLTSAISPLIISSASLNLTYARADVSAAFNFYPSSPTTYNTVSFTDASLHDPISWVWNFGDGTAGSAEQYPTHVYSAAGTYTVTLTVSNSISTAALTHSLTVSVPAYNILQGVSDQAQGTTLAFDALGLMNADLGAESYFPPGKVADYTGFQFLRDSDPSDMGHNPLFTGLASNSVIRILTDSQLAQLAALAAGQADLVNQYAYRRFALIKAFRRLMDGDMPSGAIGLSVSAVTGVSQNLYYMDGQIAFDRALLYANIYKSMTRAQKAALDAMKGVGASSWTVTDNQSMMGRIQTALGANASDKTMNTLVMTYAGDLFSWYSGSVSADVYFCPERHGTYYGGFYIKDAPAMNAPQDVSYTIDSALTGNAGAALIDSSLGYVTPAQAAIMTNLITIQKSNMDGIVAVRAQIAALLRTLLTSTASGDAVRTQVLALSSGTYGVLDGRNNYYYATAFKQEYDALSAAQRTNLKTDFWDKLLIGTYSNGTAYDYSVCKSTYLYSDPVTAPSVLAQIAPYIADTDYLFSTGAPSAEFYFSPALPLAGQTIAFTDASGGGAASWSWNFGDGSTSASQNPTHVYSSSGSYTVTLTAGNSAGSGSASHTVSVTQGSFTLTSGAGASGGAMALEYSCSGSSSSPSMFWTNAPSGTQQFALTMSEVTPQAETKYNWVLYGIPSSSSGFAKNTAGGGTPGKSDGESGTAYNPPCGPGSRLYTFRLYSLSGAPSLPSDPAQVTGGVLTAALTGITISSSSMNLTYTQLSSGAAPSAGFSYSPAAPTAGQTVIFTDTTTNTPSSWAWNFGDGSTSALQSPTHVYSSSGSFTVTLTASNTSGSSSTVRTVTVAYAYPIVDTGQTKYYNALAEISAPAAGQSFYGQDAQFSGARSSYTLSGDGKTVYDNVTRLIWMRGPNTTLSAPVKSDKKTYSAAQTYVAAVNSANYGGYGNWRLPSLKELYSLIKFSGTDPSGLSGSDTSGLTPFIDTASFNFAYGQTTAGERIIDSQYLTGNVFADNPSSTGFTKYFGVNFADGRIKGYDSKMPDGSDKTFFVQLVRGNTYYGLNSFKNNGDGSISDTATGLIWTQDDSVSSMTWQAALAWAQTKNGANYLGHGDWRLPDAKELQSIVDYSHAPDYDGKPSIDGTYFNCTAIVNENGQADYPWYWTGTTHAMYTGSGTSGVYITFGRAMGYMPAYGWVDIHGAGAQRSDPKSGNMTGYTFNTNGYYNPIAPQGDAVRGYNFVRLVRNAN